MKGVITIVCIFARNKRLLLLQLREKIEFQSGMYGIECCAEAIDLIEQWNRRYQKLIVEYQSTFCKKKSFFLSYFSIVRSVIDEIWALKIKIDDDVRRNAIFFGVLSVRLKMGKRVVHSSYVICDSLPSFCIFFPVFAKQTWHLRTSFVLIFCAEKICFLFSRKLVYPKSIWWWKMGSNVENTENGKVSFSTEFIVEQEVMTSPSFAADYLFSRKNKFSSKMRTQCKTNNNMMNMVIGKLHKQKGRRRIE